MKNKKNILTQAALSFMLSAVVLYANTGLLSAKASENDLHPSVKSIPVYAAQNDVAAVHRFRAKCQASVTESVFAVFDDDV